MCVVSGDCGHHEGDAHRSRRGVHAMSGLVADCRHRQDLTTGPGNPR
jgi:hypothetical protein